MPDTDRKQKNEASELLLKLVKESAAARKPHVQAAHLNRDMYLGYASPAEEQEHGYSYFIVNKTQSAVIAHAQVQMETRPRVVIAPRETGSPPVLFMSRQALMTIRRLEQEGHISFQMEDELEAIIADDKQMEPVESSGFTFELLDASDASAFEVTESFLEMAKPLFQPWVSQLTQQQMNPVLRPKDVVQVDDALTAQVIQNNIDILWDMDDNDAWLMSNVLYTQIFGSQGAVYFWDEELMRDCVRNLHFVTIYMPPNCEGVEDAPYCVIEELLDKDEAIERYPKLKAVIEKHAAENEQENPTRELGDKPFGGVQWERPMISVWTGFVRNHRYPMPPDDALERGRVVEKDGKFFLTDENFEPTDEQTAPGKGNWPTRRGIRQIQSVAGTDAFDGECRYWDIPVVWNKNILDPYRPYGQGEPQRMQYIARVIDLLASILFDHIKYYRSPQEIYPHSIWKRLDGLKRAHSYPGRQLHLDDRLFDKYAEFIKSGKGFVIEPPAMRVGFVEFFQRLLSLFDELSGFVNVLQGRSPGADTSGKALETLQTAARGMIGFKAFQTEKMLKRLIRLRIHAMTRNFWLPPFMWKKMNDRFPTQVLEAVRARASDMEFNIAVEVASGGGQLRERRKAETIGEVQAGLRSPQSARQIMDIEKDDPFWQPPQLPQPGVAPPPSGG